MSKFGLIFGTRPETEMLVIDNFQLARMATVSTEGNINGKAAKNEYTGHCHQCGESEHLV